MPGDTEPSLWALVGVGQGDLSLFFKAPWDPHPTRHQRPGGNLDVTACPSPSVLCGHDKDQPQSDGMSWSGAIALLFASVGLGLCKFGNTGAAPAVSEASPGHSC